MGFVRKARRVCKNAAIKIENIYTTHFKSPLKMFVFVGFFAAILIASIVVAAIAWRNRRR